MRNSMLKMGILKLILRHYYLKRCVSFALKLKKKEANKGSMDTSAIQTPNNLGEPVRKNKVAPIDTKPKFHEFLDNQSHKTPLPESRHLND